MIKKADSIIIHDWMMELGLTRTEEYLYSLIYELSKNGISHALSKRYMARSVHAHIDTVKRSLYSLRDKGLIVIEYSFSEYGQGWNSYLAIDPRESINHG